MGAKTFIFVVAVVVAGVAIIGAHSNNGSQPHSGAAVNAESASATMPDMIPPLAVREISPAAAAKAGEIPRAKFCSALGKTLRGQEVEFRRAIIKRAADLGLGVLRFGDIDSIARREIHLGMTPCMAVASWGRPVRINRTVSASGVREQWVYPASYLYFEDGILTSFQVGQ